MRRRLIGSAPKYRQSDAFSIAVRHHLEYWIDDNWFVGRLKEIPGVFSQGETLKELVENIWDAYLVLQQQLLFFDDKNS